MPFDGIASSAGPQLGLFGGRTGRLNGNPMSQSDAWNMLQRRALAGGKAEFALRMANHESSRTTGLYDRATGRLWWRSMKSSASESDGKVSY